MKKLFYMLFLIISISVQLKAQTPVAPIQLLTNSAWWEPSTHRHWFYNGTTYGWWQPTSIQQVDSAIMAKAGVTSFNGRSGIVVPLTGDYNSFYYPLSSNPANYSTYHFTGTTSQYTDGTGAYQTFPSLTGFLTLGSPNQTVTQVPTFSNGLNTNYLQLTNGAVKSVTDALNINSNQRNGINLLGILNTNIASFNDNNGSADDHGINFYYSFTGTSGELTSNDGNPNGIVRNSDLSGYACLACNNSFTGHDTVRNSLILKNGFISGNTTVINSTGTQSYNITDGINTSSVFADKFSTENSTELAQYFPDKIIAQNNGFSQQINYAALSVNSNLNFPNEVTGTLATQTDISTAISGLSTVYVPVGNSINTSSVFLNDNFNRSSLGSNWTATTTTAAITFPASSYLHVTGGDGSSNNYMTYNSLFATDKNTSSITFIPRDNTSTSYGIGLSFASSVTPGLSSIFAKISLNSTNSASFNVYTTSALSTSITGVSGLTFTVGDTLIFTAKRTGSTILYTLSDLTSNTSISIPYTYNTGLAAPYELNLANPVVYFYGGTQDLLNANITDNTQVNGNAIYLGDSITEGYAAGGSMYTYTDLVFNGNSLLFDISAGFSEKSTDAINRLPEIIANNPKYCLVNIGVNDALNSISTSVYKANIDTILSRLKSHSIIPIVINLVPQNSVDVTPYNTVLSTEATAYNVTYINIFAPLTGGSGTRMLSQYAFSDGIHPVAAGHGVMAQTIIADAPTGLFNSYLSNNVYLKSLPKAFNSDYSLGINNNGFVVAVRTNSSNLVNLTGVVQALFNIGNYIGLNPETKTYNTLIGTSYWNGTTWASDLSLGVGNSANQYSKGQNNVSGGNFAGQNLINGGNVSWGDYASQNSSSMDAAAMGDFALQNASGFYASITGYKGGQNLLSLGASGSGFAVFQNSSGNYPTGDGYEFGQNNTGANLVGIAPFGAIYNNGSNGFFAGLQSGYYNNWPNVIQIGEQNSPYFNPNAATAKTFTDANVNATAHTITITAHGFGTTGAKVNLQFTLTSGTAPAGLTNNGIYQFTITDANTLTLAAITATGSGSFTLTKDVDIDNSIAIGNNINALKNNQIKIGGTGYTETDLYGTLIDYTYSTNGIAHFISSNGTIGGSLLATADFGASIALPATTTVTTPAFGTSALTPVNNAYIPLASDAVISITTGVNTGTTGTTVLYTVPTGKTLTVTKIITRVTSSSTPTTGPTINVYTLSAGDIYNSTSLGAMTVVPLVFSGYTTGISKAAIAGGTVNYQVTTAANAAQACTITLYGTLE